MGIGAQTQSASGSERRIKLAPGQAALFGYGSLLSRASMERTLGHSYPGPFLACALPGWRRTWDAAVPNSRFFAETTQGKMYPRAILYLNVSPDPKTSVNGVIFVVDPPEMAGFNEREWIYDPVDVSATLEGVRVEGGPAYVYVAKEEHRLAGVESTSEAAVRATYLDIVEQGLAELGPDFRLAYERSTDPPPRHLVIQDHT